MGKTEELLEILRRELMEGCYEPGSRFPSEHKLMARFNAARTTINKITMQLAGEGLIEHRKKGSGTYVAESLPFPAGHLAYLGPVGHPYYCKIVDGIQRAAFLRNYALSIFSPGEDMVYYCLDRIRHSRFRGLLACNIGIIPDPFPMPVVYVDNGYETGPRVRASVTCTNYRGAAELAEAVIAHGHREIVICSHYIEVERRRADRIQGFTDVLQKYGIGDISRRVFHEPIQSAASARFLLKRILKQFPETTVIMADSDNVASLLLQGMPDPETARRITITGYGNLAFNGSLLRIPGVEQHPGEIGLQSVGELFRMMEEPDYCASEPLEIETELVNLDKIPYLR